MFCYFVSFDDTLSHSDFGIGGVVAGTTPIDHPYRRSPLIYTDIQARIWTRLGTYHLTDEFTLH